MTARTMLGAAAVALGACRGDDGDDTTETGDSATASDERTLDTCETSIDAGAPAFLRELFRCVTITVDADSVQVHTVDLPPHRSYYYGQGHANYEDFDTSRGPEYAPNPNTLAEQDVTVDIALDPVPRAGGVVDGDIDGVVGTSAGEFPMGPAGVALDGVVLFNPLAAPGDDIEDEKYTFDSYDAHPSPDLAYHYHTTSPGPLEVLAWLGRDEGAEIYGIMCDGTVVLGCTEADGTAPAGDLDAQGGHVHDVGDGTTTWFTARYHTHVCESGRRFTPEIRYYEACPVEGGGGPPV